MAGVVYLARYQVRILLCEPAAERRVDVRGRMCLLQNWQCGCAGIGLDDERVGVIPCTAHAEMLAVVSEDDEHAHYETLCKMYSNVDLPRSVRHARPREGGRP